MKANCVPLLILFVLLIIFSFGLLFIMFIPTSTNNINTIFVDYNIFNDTIEFNLPVIKNHINQPCYQLFNGSNSCIPSVICPGVQKSGTSFLYFSLINHPSIGESSIKEVNYYITSQNNPYKDGVESYSSHYNHNNKILVDFSPKYMMLPESAELIYNTNKNTKFIITLRDPVDRAYSHFRYQEKLFYDKRHIMKTLSGDCPRRRDEITFKQYISEEYSVLKKCGMLKGNQPPPPWYGNITMPDNCKTWNCKSCASCFPLSNIHVTENLGLGYLSHGLYLSHLKHYLTFFPIKNFYILKFEDLQEIGEIQMLNDICRWLGINSMNQTEWGELGNKNENDYPPINKDEEEYLRIFYKKPNYKLENLLGRKFNWN